MSKTEVEQALASAENVIVELSPAVAAGVIALQDEHYQERSFEYVLEECIVVGRKTIALRKKQGAELANVRAFSKAVAEQPDRLAELAKKFGIGASK